MAFVCKSVEISYVKSIGLSNLEGGVDFEGLCFEMIRRHMFGHLVDLGQLESLVH